MDLAINLGWGGAVLLLVGAVIIGVVAQFIGETRTGYEWIAVAIAAGIGALVASEFIVAWRTVDPVWDGLALIPAVIGGLVVGVVIDAATRFATGGTYLHGPMAA